LLWGTGIWPRRIAVRGLLAWGVIGLAAGLMPQASGELSCRFLAVGHGLSVLMELPNGKTVLYDAGSMGDASRAAKVVAQELRRRGLRRIDALILSHADADHCNALPELLRALPIGSVLIGPGFLEDDQPLPRQIVEQCAARNVPVGLLAAGHQVVLHPEVSFRVLHPAEEFISEQDNPRSLVAAVEYQGRRILLTGDVEGEGLATLLRQSSLPCDVLLSPHHGSRAANPEKLAKWSRPRYVVVSTQDAVSEERLAQTYSPETHVLATARRGAIECRIDSRGDLSVETFRGGKVAASVNYEK
jgi:competence protein ComEC